MSETIFYKNYMPALKWDSIIKYLMLFILSHRAHIYLFNIFNKYLKKNYVLSKCYISIGHKFLNIHLIIINIVSIVYGFKNT